jgi:hypothetical protein
VACRMKDVGCKTAAAPRGGDLRHLSESQGHNLALTVLHVPYSLDGGWVDWSALTVLVRAVETLNPKS